MCWSNRENLRGREQRLSEYLIHTGFKRSTVWLLHFKRKKFPRLVSYLKFAFINTLIWVVERRGNRLEAQS